MADKIHSQTSSTQMYPNYGLGRMPYNSPSYAQLNASSMNIGSQNPLNNMTNLKAALPGGGSTGSDLTSLPRNNNGGNNPLMVLPSGQTVPVSAFYSQQQSSSTDENNNFSYVPTGMFPGFVGNSGIGSTPMSYNWPYPVANNVPALDPARRGSWSSHDDSTPITPAIPGMFQPDYYSSAYPIMIPVTSAATQQYIAGPIQPMKTGDNKNYEMVNLDELVQRDPPIPRAVPALWTNQEELSLAKCLQNPEGITNIYIRGFMPDTTDEMLESYAARFGEIESCKAIIDQDTGKCKGFGFVLYYSPAAAENCIRGFYHMGFQASYAQKSRNSRLKDLEDRTSTNIYCTGVPIDWNEADLCKHFLPYRAVSTKICRDAPSGVSKEVGFARFDSREIAERVIKDFHSAFNEHDSVKLYLRFADTKAQKQLKQQSQERRNWRSREYSYSVEHTPSPTLTRPNNVIDHISPGSHISYQTPAGPSATCTPETSVSPPELPGTTKVGNGSAWPMSGGLTSITNTSTVRTQLPALPLHIEVPSKPITTVPSHDIASKIRTPSPKKVIIKIEPASGKENVTITPHTKS